MRYKGALFAAAAALVVLPVLTPAAAQPVSPEVTSQGNTGTVPKEWYTRHSADEAPYPLVSANTVLPGRVGLPPEAASQGNAGTVSKEWYTRHSADEAPYPLVSANTVLPGRAGLTPEAASRGNTGTVSKEWYTRHSADEAPYPLVSANAVLPGREGLPPSVSQMPGVKAAPYGGPRSQAGIAACERRFRSFNHTTGTYTANSGQKFLCPYLGISKNRVARGRG
ncbi:MAG: BA14K family protein [Rhodomicrobium sp.]